MREIVLDLSRHETSKIITSRSKGDIFINCALKHLRNYILCF